MPNIRIKDIPTTASATSSTDFIGIDGSANGTRKLNAFSPTFGGNLTVSGTGTSSFSGPVTAFDNTNGGAFYVLRDAGNNRGSFYFGRNNSGTIQITGSVNGSSDATSVNNGILTLNATNGSGTLVEGIRLNGATNLTTISGNLTVSGGTSTFGTANGGTYITTPGTAASTGSLFIQGGNASGSTAGGGVVLYGGSHASAPGWVRVGLAGTSKFAVNTSGLGAGTDVFTVDQAGNLTVSGGAIGTAASTNLTLNGGSSGASLVLGQGANAGGTFTNKGTGFFTFNGPNFSNPDTGGTVLIYSNDSAAIDKGGSLLFGGSYTGTTQTVFAGLAGRKENATAGNYAGYLQFYTGTQASALEEVARLTSTGNFLIGTTTDVGPRLLSKAKDNTYAGAGIGIVDQSAGTSYITRANGTFYISNNGSTDHFALDTSGNATFAGTVTTSTTNSSQNAGIGNKFISSGAVWVVNAATNDAFSYYNSSAAAYRFYVDSGGTISATNTAISAISDARLKENVRDLSGGLSSILALKPRVFDWKEGKGANKKNVRGFIAQEIEQVFPDLVDEWKDAAPEGEAPYKSVRQDLIPVLVKAIQELTARVVALENA